MGIQPLKVFLKSESTSLASYHMFSSYIDHRVYGARFILGDCVLARVARRSYPGSSSDHIVDDGGQPLSQPRALTATWLGHARRRYGSSPSRLPPEPADYSLFCAGGSAAASEDDILESSQDMRDELVDSSPPGSRAGSQPRKRTADHSISAPLGGIAQKRRKTSAGSVFVGLAGEDNGTWNSGRLPR